MEPYSDGSPAPPRRELPLLDLVAEASRQLEICNACRYCEGYCAVFPALERRTAFGRGDVEHIANLCHDCRACYYACPFAPPHVFAVNLPAVLSAVRTETYERYAVPRLLARLVRHARAGAAGLALLGIAVIVVLVLVFSDPARLAQAQTGPGSFYRVLPHLVVAIPALVVSAGVVAALLLGGLRFWRATGSRLRDLFDVHALAEATGEAMSLRYLRGGEDSQGCYYPSDRPSQGRRVAHALVFYGFLLAFVSTAVAAFQQEILGQLPPYPILSVPVVTGSVGGIMLIAGCTALLGFKARSDPRPGFRTMLSMDVAFLVLLDLASITGMALLVLRDTGVMGTILVGHLGVLAALYVTAPYSKFAHVIYRYAALLRNKLEERAERVAPGGV